MFVCYATAGLPLRDLPLLGARALLHACVLAVLFRRLGHQHPRRPGKQLTNH